MAHPASRALAVLELLQSRNRVSGAEMAERLGVHPRTIRRYVTVLEDVGIPITAERGRFGAYSLVPGFKLPPMLFSRDEALALAVGLLASRGLGLDELTAAAASAQAKLERVLPEALRGRVRGIAAHVRLDLLSRSSAVGGDGGHLPDVAAAAEANQRLHLHYVSADGARSERDFDPYGLAFLDGHWYATGFCHLRNTMRSFRLDRIRTLRTCDHRFQRPPGFDALTRLNDDLARLPRSVAAEVVLHTDLRTATERLGVRLGLFEHVEDGVLLRAQVDDLDWFAGELAALPFDFSVRAPHALRRALGDLAARLLACAGHAPEE